MCEQGPLFHRQVLLCFTGHNRGGAASLHGRHRHAGMQGVCLYCLSSRAYALVHWSVCVCVASGGLPRPKPSRVCQAWTLVALVGGVCIALEGVPWWLRQWQPHCTGVAFVYVHVNLLLTVGLVSAEQQIVESGGCTATLARAAISAHAVYMAHAEISVTHSRQCVSND